MSTLYPLRIDIGIENFIRTELLFQCIDPAHELALGLIPELGLTVECPAEQPAGIPCRDNTACDGPAAERVTLADVLDVGHDAFVQRGDRGAHPVGLFRIGAELLRAVPSYESMAKQAIVRVFNTIMTRAGITLIVTVAFSISSIL